MERNDQYVGKLLSDSLPFAITEAFKMLRTNLFYTAKGEKCPVYGITSTFSNSGTPHISTADLSFTITLQPLYFHAANQKSIAH